MDEFNVMVIVWKEDSAFVSKCLELEVASAGYTQHEALENRKEVVELYIENAQFLGIDRVLEV